MSLHQVPDEIPAEALARALANLGLVHVAIRRRDGVNVWRWAKESGVSAVRLRHSICDCPDCTRPATVHLGGLQYCAVHYMERARSGALV